MKDRTSVLILENLRSVENTASIFRTADGFGVSKIYLIGTTPAPLDRFGRERKDFAKVSLGAEKTVPWQYEKNILPVITELKDQGFQVISLEQDPRAQRLKEFKPQDKLALIVGSETEGVSKEALEASEVIVEIPMEGMKESLNVSVAAGVAMYMLIYKNA